MTTPNRRPADITRAAINGPSLINPHARNTILITPVIKAFHVPVRVLLGDGISNPSSDSGWSFVSRPKQTGFTTWTGRMPYTMTIPLMFDGFTTGHHQEEDWENLRSIAREPVGPEKQPTPVKISGPLPLTHLLWVIQSLEKSEEIRREEDGLPVRIVATMTLMQYVEADVIISAKKSPAKKASAKAKQGPQPAPLRALGSKQIADLKKKGWVKGTKEGAGYYYPPGWKKAEDGTYVPPTFYPKGSATRTHVMKSGDTLAEVAQKYLGNHARWQEIAKLNGIRDPRTIKVGTRLKIPA